MRRKKLVAEMLVQATVLKSSSATHSFAQWIASTQTGLSGRFAAPFAQVHKYALATSPSRMSTEAYHVEKQRKRSLVAIHASIADGQTGVPGSHALRLVGVARKSGLVRLPRRPKEMARNALAIEVKVRTATWPNAPWTAS